jgi:hypothetical protein
VLIKVGLRLAQLRPGLRRQIRADIQGHYLSAPPFEILKGSGRWTRWPRGSGVGWWTRQQFSA